MRKRTCPTMLPTVFQKWQKCLITPPYCVYMFAILGTDTAEDDVRYDIPLLCLHPPSHRLRGPQCSQHRSYSPE